MADRYQKTHFVEVKGVTVDTETGVLSWTGIADHEQTEDVFDRDEDGLLDRDEDVWQSLSFPFTGYTVEIDGDQFAIFSSGSYYLIPYRKDDFDVFAAMSPNGSTSEFFDEIAAANCFLTGTRIDTPDRSCPIEALKPGDLVLAADGSPHRVLWVAHQTIETTPWLAEGLLPVRIPAHALGPDRPARDLLLSADHALVLDGLLVNAAALTSEDGPIRFEPLQDMPAQFTYWHVETEAHIALVANGLPAESFIDYASRGVFDNYDEYLALNGADRIIPEMPLARVSSRRHLPPALRPVPTRITSRVA